MRARRDDWGSRLYRSRSAIIVFCLDPRTVRSGDTHHEAK